MIDTNYFLEDSFPGTAYFDPDSVMTYHLKPEYLATPPELKGIPDDKLDDASRRLKEMAEETGMVNNYDLSDLDTEALKNVYGTPITVYPVTGTVHIDGKDDELERADETINKTRTVQLYISSQGAYSSTLIKEFRWGGELRVEVHVASRRVTTTGIEMKARVVLFEGAHRYTTDHEDEAETNFIVPRDGSWADIPPLYVENVVFREVKVFEDDALGGLGGLINVVANVPVKIVNEVVASDEATVTLRLRKGNSGKVVFSGTEFGAPSAKQSSAADVNGDGQINVADLILVSHYLDRPAPATPPVDVNADGIVTMADLVYVAQYLGQSMSTSAPVRLARARWANL